MYSGIDALDRHDGFLADFADTLRSRLWVGASRHYAGGGLERGADCRSYRILIDQFSAVPGIGHRLGEVMVSCAVGGVWPRAKRRAEMP
eukprot:6800723-Pyramimonas_sp.AAC.1